MPILVNNKMFFSQEELSTMIDSLESQINNTEYYEDFEIKYPIAFLILKKLKSMKLETKMEVNNEN